MFRKNLQKHAENVNQHALVRTKHVYVLMTVHNCSTQYNTEQF